jgi:hypothetical protein
MVTETHETCVDEFGKMSKCMMPIRPTGELRFQAHFHQLGLGAELIISWQLQASSNFEPDMWPLLLSTERGICGGEVRCCIEFL